MHELTRVKLENEMDLILVHKRSMKLAEMSDLTLSAQTIFATAVSEVARMSLDTKKNGYLSLSIDQQNKERYIVASLKLNTTATTTNNSISGLEFAKKLVAKYNVISKDNETMIELFYYISPPFKIDSLLIDKWRSQFRNEPPISPYEELKRKNEQLLELSEKVQKSEAEYINLTNTLPLFIFSMDEEGNIIYANRWLTDYTGESLEKLNETRWSEVIHSEDYDAFSLLLKKNNAKASSNLIIQTRIRHKLQNLFKWHQVSLSPFRNEFQEIQFWTGYIADIHAQKEYEQTLKDNAELKESQEQLKNYQARLEENILELNRSNYELQQFAFIASHDLQEPLRKLMFNSDYMLQHYGKAIDDKAEKILQNMHSSSKRMRLLIHDLLSFSQVDKSIAEFTRIDLNTIAAETLQELEMKIAEKEAVISVGPLPLIDGDARMIRQLFENIVSNSLKYSKKNESPIIRIDALQNGDNTTITFRDNGIGFDEQHLTKMFDLFQRLHRKQEYEGTGIGLAICRKIVEVHKGKIWAHGKENEGAFFYIELPIVSNKI